MTRVWASSQQKGSTLLLLLSIADYANERGVAYPSIATLAQKVRMTERNVQKLLGKLAESGELIIKPNAGPAGCNLYRIVLNTTSNTAPAPSPADCKGGEKFSPPQGENFSGGGEKSGQGGERQFTGGVNASSPDPSLEPPIDPSVDDDTRATPTAASSSSSQPPAPALVLAEEMPAPTNQPPVRLPAAAVAQAIGRRDPAWLAAKAAYENNIGLLTPLLSQRLEEALATYPPEWVPAAIARAVTAEKRRWDYVEGILRNWSTEGCGGQRSRPSAPQRSSKRAGHAQPPAQPAEAAPDSYADLILQ
jgi:DnaD/phage-associated family protein